MSATTKNKKIALGMSGGVDSSVAAHLLVAQGYQVTGIFLECWRAPGCRTDQDRQDALKVALDLGIPFQVLDFKTAYREKVVQLFFDQYQAGLTPNPDVWCNQEIKFGLFYDWAMAQGFDSVATGHYAKTTELENPITKVNQPQLVIPADHHKDQTYFLYLLKTEQLARIEFPLGDLTKPQVRQQAEKLGLSVAQKKDSVGICFIGDINVHDFLKSELGENPGAVVDTHGRVIGQHQGLWFYTIGQRHGFTIDAKTIIKNLDGSETIKHNLPPFYVIAKKPEQNQLVVGFGSEAFQDKFMVHDLHWLTQPIATQPLLVRIRHTGEIWPAELQTVNSTNTTVSQVGLAQPIKGIAGGQAAVFYQQWGNEVVCLGGGVIS